MITPRDFDATDPVPLPSSYAVIGAAKAPGRRGTVQVLKAIYALRHRKLSEFKTMRVLGLLVWLAVAVLIDINAYQGLKPSDTELSWFNLLWAWPWTVLLIVGFEVGPLLLLLAELGFIKTVPAPAQKPR